MRSQPFNQIHCSCSDVGIEDDTAKHTSVKMLTVDGFIEAVISWHTVSQHCQHSWVSSTAITPSDTVNAVVYCRWHDVSATTNKPQCNITTDKSTAVLQPRTHRLQKLWLSALHTYVQRLINWARFNVPPNTL